MKLSCLVLLSLLGASDAWVVPKTHVASRTTTALQGANEKNPSWSTAAAVALTGWALATQVASAGMPTVTAVGA